jgi:type II secretory pathway component PulK
LNELFTSTSGGFININTASAKVLQIIPGIQENMADAIVQARSGGNGPNMGAMPAADGSDYTPFRSVQELARVPEFAAYPQLMQMVGNYFSVRSLVFEVTVKAQIGNSTRTYVALLKRASPRDIQVMSMYWK